MRSSIEPLLGPLATPSERGRVRAAQRIARLGRVVVPDLVEALRREPNAYVRSGVAIALARIRDRRAGPALRGALLGDPAMTVRLHALLAIRDVPGTAYEQAIVRALRDASGAIRLQAVDALARRGSRHAARALRDRLGDDRWYVRQHAASALGALRAASARAALSAARDDPRKAVRDAARRALERLGSTRTLDR